MGKEIVLFKSEGRKELQSVAAFLQQLAEKLTRNQLVFLQGTEEFMLTVPGDVAFELKVEEETSKGSTKRALKIEIEWVEGD